MGDFTRRKKSSNDWRKERLRMNKKKLPVGIDSFEKLRREDFYYIDKTTLIRDLLNNWGEVNLQKSPPQPHLHAI